MQMLWDLLPAGQPVIAHVLPGLVVVPPARGLERVLDLEEKREKQLHLKSSI